MLGAKRAWRGTVQKKFLEREGRWPYIKGNGGGNKRSYVKGLRKAQGKRGIGLDKC